LILDQEQHSQSNTRRRRRSRCSVRASMIVEQEEDLLENPFFIALRTTYLRFYRFAEERCLMVCVPQASVARHLKLNADVAGIPSFHRIEHRRSAAPIEATSPLTLCRTDRMDDDLRYISRTCAVSHRRSWFVCWRVRVPQLQQHQARYDTRQHHHTQEGYIPSRSPPMLHTSRHGMIASTPFISHAPSRDISVRYFHHYHYYR